jgi:integrase
VHLRHSTLVPSQQCPSFCKIVLHKWKRGHLKHKRGQRGSLRIESGSWYGYYNTYVSNETGDSVRKQKSIKIGPAEGPNKLSKWDAYAELAKEIEKQTAGSSAARPDGTVTLQKFTETRWLPLRVAKLRPSSKASTMHTLSHIFKKFGSTPLEQLDKVEMQTWLNQLAQKYNKSLVLHAKFYLKSILAEALDQEYILKNPANKLESPRTKQVANDVLTPEIFRAVVAILESPYDLMVRVTVACAFRPSELLALRWRDLDVEAKVFRIKQTVYRGEIRPYTKTTEADEQDATLLTVPVPDSLLEALREYRGEVYQGKETAYRGKRYRIVDKENMVLDWYVGDDDFIFHNLENGNFLNKENILFRIFNPAAEKVAKEMELSEFPALNFQTLRRTAATLAQNAGSVKDIQGLLRHRTPDVTAGVYMQPVSESTRRMVNSVYEELTKTPASESA